MASLLSLIQRIYALIKSKQELYLEVLFLRQQLGIVLRTTSKRQIARAITLKERIWFANFLHCRDKLIHAWKLFSPDTLLRWYRNFLKNRWIRKPSSPGRKRIAQWIKKLVISIKQVNRFFGLNRIKGELLKLDVDLSRTSIQRILHDARRTGKLKPTGSWAQFLRRHGKSLFACDFFTVDTALNKRYFVFFVIHIVSRKIVQWNLTQHPTKEFVRQQAIALSDTQPGPIHLIHDHGPELMSVSWENYGIESHPTSVCSPNLNAYAERFVGSIRRECLDHFIVFTGRHVRNIVREYVDYYNGRRPHQGIGNVIPDRPVSVSEGLIKSQPMLFGLVRDFYRSVA